MDTPRPEQIFAQWMGAVHRRSRAKETAASAKRTRLDPGSITAQMREVGRLVCGLTSFFLHTRLISVQGHMITLWAESCMCVNSALICFRKWFLKRCSILLLLESFHTKQTTPRKMESEAVAGSVSEATISPGILSLLVRTLAISTWSWRNLAKSDLWRSFSRPYEVHACCLY